MLDNPILKTVKPIIIDVAERRRKDYGDIEELKASIKANTQLQPIAIMEYNVIPPEGFMYKLLAGGRRLQACFELEIPIDAKIYPEMCELDQRTAELIENIDRKDLTYFEKLTLTKDIHELQVKKFGVKHGTSKTGHSIRDTAKMLGRAVSGVAEDIKLANILTAVPEVASQCKNKDEARKLIKKVQKVIDVEKRVAAFDRVTKPTEIKGLEDGFIIGDAFAGSKTLDKGFIDWSEVDPPYAINLHKVKKNADLASMGDYRELNPEDYCEEILELGHEIYRAMKPKGWVIFWFSIRWWFEETAKCLEEAGFLVNRNCGIWVKPGGQSMAAEYNLASCYDTFFYCRKGPITLAKPGRSNVFNFSPVPAAKKVHPTERPIEMLQEILGTFVLPNTIGFVPFLGSGNTMLAANNLKMKTFGYDLSQNHKNDFLVKLQDMKAGEYKSY